MVTAQDAAPQALLAATGGAVRELRWVRTLGQTTVLAQGAIGRPTLLDSHTALARAFDPEALRVAAARLPPDAVARIEALAAYDLYYYAREAHTMTGAPTSRCPSCGWSSMTRMPPGFTSIPTQAPCWAAQTAAGVSAAGCLPCCTVGTGCLCWSAVRCGTAC